MFMCAISANMDVFGITHNFSNVFFFLWGLGLDTGSAVVCRSFGKLVHLCCETVRSALQSAIWGDLVFWS